MRTSSHTELLGEGEAVREVEEGVEETLLFKLINGTEEADISEAEVATNSDEESNMLAKAKRSLLLQVEQLVKVPLKPLEEAESSGGWLRLSR